MAEGTSIATIKISLGVTDEDMIAGLKRSSQKTKDWSSDMAKILSKTGRDQLAEILAQRKLIDGLNTTEWQEKYVAKTQVLQNKYLENQRSVWKTFLAESKVIADSQLAIEKQKIEKLIALEKQKTEGLVALEKQSNETRIELLRQNIQQRLTITDSMVKGMSSVGTRTDTSGMIEMLNTSQYIKKDLDNALIAQKKYAIETEALQNKYLSNQRQIWQQFLIEGKVIADQQFSIERQKTEGIVALDKDAAEKRILLLREDIQRRNAAANEEIAIMRSLTAERDNLYNTANRKVTPSMPSGMSATEADALRADITGRYAQDAAAALKSEQETNRELGKQISARLTIRTIRMQQQEIFDKQETSRSSKEALADVQQMLSSTKQANDPMLKLMEKLKKEAVEFKALLDKANLSPELRKEYVEQFLAAQQLTVQEYKLNDIRQEGQALIRSLMTAEQAHTARVVRYTEMLELAIIDQNQFNAAVEQSKKVMDSGVSGYGKMTGALTQASFAAEDFIQVLSMGGGLNMALMSASNNLSMVARAAIPATSAMGAMASAAIPILLIGLGSVITYLMNTKDALDEVGKAADEVRKRFENFGKMTETRIKMDITKEEIQNIESVDALESQRVSLLNEQRLLKEILLKQEMETEAANRATFTEIIGGQEAMLEIQNLLNRAQEQGTEEQKAAALELQRLFDAAAGAASQGQVNTALENLREFYALLRAAGPQEGAMYGGGLGIQGIDITAFDQLKSIFNDPATVDAMDKLFGGGILGQTENAELQKKFAEALIDPAIELTDEQRRQLEITQALLDLQEQQLVLEQKAAEESHRKSTEEARLLKIKQEENLLDIKATDEQKALLDVQRQMMAHIGVDSTGLADMSAAQEQAGIDFLNAYAGVLENNLKDMQAAAMPQAQGALEQDAFKAQAKAFDEVMKAASKKPDPQIEKTNKKLEEIREAIANGGVIQIVQ